MNITIFVGTMTGTAEMVAGDIKKALSPLGHDVAVVLMDGLNAQAFEKPGAFLICTSTYGQGDVPDNAMKLYNKLCADKPDLSAVRYGVIALGDRAYNETYTQGGLRFDEILSQLKARRIGEILKHDASGDKVPEEAGVAWAKEWLKLIA